MKLVDLTKTYRTQSGLKVRLFAIDMKGTYPVAGAVTFEDNEEVVQSFTCHGHYSDDNADSEYNLVEYWPAQELKLDAKLWVRRDVHQEWEKRHFARYEDGLVFCFSDGQSSFTHTTKISVSWALWTDKDPT